MLTIDLTETCNLLPFFFAILRPSCGMIGIIPSKPFPFYWWLKRGCCFTSKLKNHKHHKFVCHHDIVTQARVMFSRQNSTKQLENLVFTKIYWKSLKCMRTRFHTIDMMSTYRIIIVNMKILIFIWCLIVLLRSEYDCSLFSLIWLSISSSVSSLGICHL